MERSLIHSDVIKLTTLVKLSVYLSRILGYGESLKDSDVFGQLSAKILGFNRSEKYMKLLYFIKDPFDEPAVKSEENAV